ncbi:solute carrier family 17 member 9 isoform X2 [Mustela erminea]|uniref:solute carrier family 17 member 9 isoform X2 n=1 Tax=Mustela erminea TaxID=36723 RepID=UPI0013870562|nr:solute carrier family 17 member 9 isoform X2 [Mustela erminea]XP_032205974.1 solute carrier family 17 member 9 isoform X2 [Mustela erminea]
MVESQLTGTAGSPRTDPARPECQTWTATLLLGTCLLYCARVSVPVCTVSLSQDFGWNKKEAGLVLSSFFWGYCLTQVVGGHLGDRIGGEKVILLSACAWGFLTAATPLLAYLSGAHLVFMTFSRILTGLLQGVYFPALTSLLSQKVRESERAFTYSTVGAGSQFGMLVTGAVGSLLLDRYGWPSVFYFSGGLTLLWVCYVYRCLLNRKDLILALGILAQGLPMSRHTKVPWRQLFRKPSVWAAVSSQLSSACSFFVLLSWLPTFFQETFPSSKGWVFNVVPWLVAIPASLFSGFLSDHLINQAAPAGTQQGPSGAQHKWADGTVSPSPPRSGYRTITVRKFMQVMGLGLSSVFALCLGHTSSFCTSVVFASASIGLQTFNHSGISVNIQDLAPSCAGFLFGVANTAGALAGVVGVCLGGYLLETTGSWASMFNLVAAVGSLGLCTFLLFGEAQRVDLSPAHEDL